MLTPHYIELNRDTMDEVVQWTHADVKALEENYLESLEMAMPFYIVFERTENGLPKWTCYTMVEFATEYRLEKINQLSQKAFVKL